MLDCVSMASAATTWSTLSVILPHHWQCDPDVSNLSWHPFSSECLFGTDMCQDKSDDLCACSTFVQSIGYIPSLPAFPCVAHKL